MKLRRRVIPVAALVMAIGASAAGAATAAESGGSGNAGGSGAKGKASCEIKLDGDTFKKGAEADKKGIEAKIEAKMGAKAGDGLDGKLAGTTTGQAPDKGRIVSKGGIPLPADACKKKVAVIGLDTVAAKLGVTKTALVQALKQTEQWVVSSPTKPSAAQFEQHLADLLHVPVAKVVSVIGVGQHTVMKHGA